MRRTAQRALSKTSTRPSRGSGLPENYGRLVSNIEALLERARQTTVRAVNHILTTTYWEIGRRVVEFEQGGKAKAAYGDALLVKLSGDLTKKYGRGFSWRNIYQMRTFYLGWEILQTPSAKLEARVKSSLHETTKANSPGSDQPFRASLTEVIPLFPLSWSHYVRLMSVENPRARGFYESEAIRGGWSVRQLDRQISTLFFERTVKSKNQTALLAKGQTSVPEDAVTLEESIRDPYLLEFLNLKDEYSETDLEEAIVRHLEWFLLELGAGFTFVARQKRIRVGDEWYRIDLVLFHRKLKCLVVIDLKLGKFTHADAGQMNLYLNYAREHLTEPGENAPIGLILCSAKNSAVVHYAMGGINAKVFASHYLTELPNEETLRNEILTTQRIYQANLLSLGKK